MSKKGNANTSNISIFLFILMTVRYTIAYNEHFRTNQRLWLLISAVVAIFFLYKIVCHRAIVQPSYFVWWSIAVYAYFSLSILWSISKEFSKGSYPLAMACIMGSLTSFVVTNRKDLKRLMVINSIALVACGLYVRSAVDPDTFRVSRIGQSMEGLWNSNGISLTMCMGAMISFYFFDTTKRKILKLVNFLFFVFFVYLILYCGSRSGLLVLLISILSYLILKAKGFRRVWVIIAGIIAIAALYYLIMNYEPLYLVIGNRVENAINGVIGKGTSEDSFNIRHNMIVNGFRWFLRRPVFGYGLDNFRVLYYQNYGKMAYGHNNFIELLVDGGLVGIGIYYSMYFYIFYQLWTFAVKEKDRLSIYLLCSCLGNFVVSFFSVINYTSTECNMMLLMSNIYIMIRKREETRRWQVQMRQGTNPVTMRENTATSGS